MKLSIGKKSGILIIAAVILVGLLSGFLGDYISDNIIEKIYFERAVDLAKTTALMVDTDKLKVVRDEVMDIFNATEDPVSSEDWGSEEFFAYLDKYADIVQMPEFSYVRDQLRSVLEVNHVSSVYICYFDSTTNGTIYLVDAGYEDACPPGCYDPYYSEEARIAAINDPSAGMAPVVSKTPEYGWLVATGMPIFDENGDIVAYAAVDMSMDEIAVVKNGYNRMMAGVLFLVSIVIIFLGILTVRKAIVNPINILSATSVRYCDEMSKGDDTERHDFADLKIKTGDEIEVLADSMKKMEQDINEHIKDLLHAREKLDTTMDQAEEMSALANADALTGVRNKRAYESEEAKLNADISAGMNINFGIAMIDLNDLKVINDNYGHDAGDEALKIICRLICDTFKHSPVYRVGGDEFVVILKFLDYEHRNELFGVFKNLIEYQQEEGNIDKWRAVSAAIGSADYDRTRDKCVADVYKRADEAMYECKREMKSRAVR